MSNAPKGLQSTHLGRMERIARVIDTARDFLNRPSEKHLLCDDAAAFHVVDRDVYFAGYQEPDDPYKLLRGQVNIAVFYGRTGSAPTRVVASSSDEILKPAESLFEELSEGVKGFAGATVFPGDLLHDRSNDIFCSEVILRAVFRTAATELEELKNPLSEEMLKEIVTVPLSREELLELHELGEVSALAGCNGGLFGSTPSTGRN